MFAGHSMLCPYDNEKQNLVGCGADGLDRFRI